MLQKAQALIQTAPVLRETALAAQDRQVVRTSASANTASSKPTITATASDVKSGELAGTAKPPAPGRLGKSGPDDTHFVDAAIQLQPAPLAALVGFVVLGALWA